MCCFRWCGRRSASATCRFRESIPHPVQPLSTLRTPRRRDARKIRSRPACSALNGPDFHWQAHSSFPLAPRIWLPPRVCDGEALFDASPTCTQWKRIFKLEAFLRVAADDRPRRLRRYLQTAECVNYIRACGYDQGDRYSALRRGRPSLVVGFGHVGRSERRRRSTRSPDPTRRPSRSSACR